MADRPQRAGPTPIRPVRRQASADKAYVELLERILDGRLDGGSTLRLARLSESLGLSQTPIREALSRLEGQGLVDRQPMKGYTVAEPLSEEDSVKLLQVRLLLEPEIAARAAFNAVAEDVRALQASLDDSRKVTATDQPPHYRDYLMHSARFHTLLGAAARQRFLIDSLNALPIHLQRFRRFSIQGVDDVDLSIAEHEEILTAVTAGDAMGARAAMHSHVSGIFARSARVRSD